MASPVDTSVKHFHYDMLGSPVLNGVAGAAIGLWDANLVTGWGLKSATLVVSGGVATLSFAGTHGAMLDMVILVEGVTGALTDLNGEQRVTALAAGQIKFATAAPDGTAAGTVTFKVAPAGWEKVFSFTNGGVYRSLHLESTKMYLRIDDAGTTSFRMRGYETMSDANTGAGLFPLDSQINGGGWCNKSSVANATPVKWTMVADARGGYLSIVGYSATSPATESGRTIFFGDFQPLRTGGDPHAFALGCSAGGAYSEASGVCDETTSITYQFTPRAFHGLGGPFPMASIPESGGNTKSGVDTTFGKFPSEVDGGMALSRRFISLTAQAPRGVFPGLYTIPQSEVGMGIAPRSIQLGAGVLAGRKLIAVGCGSATAIYPSTALGISMIDITGPWAR